MLTVEAAATSGEAEGCEGASFSATALQNVHRGHQYRVLEAKLRLTSYPYSATKTRPLLSSLISQYSY